MRYLTIVLLVTFYSMSNSLAETFKTDIKTVTTSGEYTDVKEMLEMAITDQGMVISKVFHISDMLQRTAKAVGATKTVYGKGEILSFCSATLSRKMMEVDPSYISFCPFKISIYYLPKQTNNIQLTYQTIQSPDFQKINQLLADIVAAAIE